MSVFRAYLRRVPARDRRHRLLILGLCLVCLAAYAPALQGPFLFDDRPNLVDNRLLHIDGRTADDWRIAAFSSDAGVLHRPVAMLTFAANYAVAGHVSALGFKGTNLALHLVIGVLIYGVCRALLQTPALVATGLGDRPRIALVAAGLWLLHPLHVSTVLYVVQRMAQLSTFFTLLGLLVYCRYRLRWVQAGASTGEMISAALWLALITLVATLAKENGVLLPWLIAVLEVVLLRGMWHGGRSGLLRCLGWVALVAPLLLVALVYLLAPELLVGGYASREFTLEERVLTQSRLLWRYLGWILLPNITDMGLFHDDIAVSHGLFAPPSTALALLAWAGLSAFAVGLRRRYPLLLFALLFYAVGHALESTVLPLEMVFEHRNYLPAVGICLLFAAVLVQITDRVQRLRPQLALALVFSVLLVQVVLRAQAWTGEEALARFNAINHPASPRAQIYYGNALFERLGQAGESKLDAQAQQSLAVAARLHVLRAQALAPTYLPPLVLLYQLDTLHFPALAEQHNWLGEIEALASAKRLQSDDRSALSALTSFALSRSGRAAQPRVTALLAQLVARYPGRLNLVLMHYRLLSAQPDADRRVLRAYLEDALGNSAARRRLYALLIHYHSGDGRAATLDWIKSWMGLDSRRQELGLQRRLLAR
ncbi:MAG: hypothetical protein HRT77_05310 [Halioglobus sp.]|nr:hypothetical protein [Halioglobus sp.]